MLPEWTTLLVVATVAAWLGLGAFGTAHAVMYKRDPRSSALWGIVNFTLPILGPWLYWGFGINRVRRRAIKRLGWRARTFRAADHAPTGEVADPAHDAVAHLTGLHAVADRMTHLPLLPGNAVEPLHNGEQAYPAMLDAIRSATRSVTLASYIFDWDDVGRSFADALADAARRGVRVHVLLDGLGAVRTCSRVGRRLIRAGAEVSAFFPLRFPLGRVRLNLRNHRKTLVVDGQVGFTGGMNISARHLAKRPDPRRVEDLQFRITGPVVGEMQQTFAEDWFLATDDILAGPAYYPEIDPAGPALCRSISSGPDEHIGTIHWIIQAAIADARERVRIATPYFIPSRTLIETMGVAAMRGVDVRVVLPSIVDLPFMRWAADAYHWQLLQSGVRIYRRRPPFVHTKLMIVDDRWVLLGSANLDPRSFRLNFEFNIEVYDRELAGRLGRTMDDDMITSDEVTLDEVDARSRPVRLRDGLVKVFSPYL